MTFSIANAVTNESKHRSPTTVCDYMTVQAILCFSNIKTWKKRQHFLSQNNPSHGMTIPSAIFTRPKLQLKFLQLHAAAMGHMLLPIIQPIRRMRTGPSSNWRTWQKGCLKT